MATMTESSTGAQSESGLYSRIAWPLHTVLLLAAIGIQAYRSVTHGDQMRAVNLDRIRMYELTILVEWLMLGFVIVGVRLNGSPLAAVLGGRWHSVREVARDVGIGFAFMVVGVMVTSMIGSHADGDRSTQFLLPHGGKEIALWIVVSLTAGICEEAVYRGYLQRQFTALTKNVPAGIILSAGLFGAAHSYQGVRHAAPIAVLGAMTGVLTHWRKSVRPGMIAHAMQDTLAIFVRH